MQTSTYSPRSGRQPPGPVYSPLAGFLSYLVPGLGQICQGRTSKGLFFLASLYGLFFGGMALGDWKNVYIPDTTRNNAPSNLPPLVNNIYSRPQFAGQVWIGIAAWPAIWQYNHFPVPSAETSPFWHFFGQTPPENRMEAPPDWQGRTLVELQNESDKTWDLGWVYTVIAGVLNVLVIYDAFAGPTFGFPDRARPQGVAA
jgi:hypothetical protein